MAASRSGNKERISGHDQSQAASIDCMTNRPCDARDLARFLIVTSTIDIETPPHGDGGVEFGTGAVDASAGAAQVRRAISSALS